VKKKVQRITPLTSSRVTSAKRPTLNLNLTLRLLLNHRIIVSTTKPKLILKLQTSVIITHSMMGRLNLCPQT